MNPKFFVWCVLEIFLAFFVFHNFTFLVYAETGENIKTTILSGTNMDTLDNTKLIKPMTGSVVKDNSGFQNQNIGAEGDIITSDTTMLSGTNDQLQENLSGIILDNQPISKTGNISGEVIYSGIDRQSGQVIDNSMSKTGEIEEDNLDIMINKEATSEKNNSSIPKGENITAPQLLITEVFFDGRDERIEIMNEGTEFFSGDITIVGAKEENIILKNVQLSATSTLVIGDKFNMLIDRSIIFQSGLKLSITDIKSINISLLLSGNIVDTFQVAPELVIEANKQRYTSFHKFSDTKDISITENKYANNVLSGYVANPGTVYATTDIGDTNGNTGSGDNTGLNVGIETIPQLIISEIYPYQNPYLELTNLSDTEDFSGTIILSGSTSIAQDIHISAGQQYVLYTNPGIFEQVEQLSGQEMNFTIPTTSAITIDLVYSGKVIDTFFVHSDRVTKSEGDFTSFEKIGTGADVNDYSTTTIGLNLDRVYNLKSPYLGNPGKIFPTAEHHKDVTKAIPNIPNANTGVQTPINCDDFRNKGMLSISEIFPGNQTFHPYIEIENPGDIAESYEYILLSGTALSGAIYYSTTALEHNKMLLLTDTEQRYNEGLDASNNTDFALQSSGRITLYGVNYIYDDDFNLIDSEQDILDIVYYSGFIADKSLYYNTHDIQCGKILDEVLNFSPTFDDKLLSFFSVQSDPVVKTVYVGGGGGSCSYDRETRFDPAPKQNTDPVEIKTIKYHDANLQHITLKSKDNRDINLRNYRLQTLNPLQYYPLPVKTLFAGKERIMTGDFSLPRQDSCVNLLKDDVVIDRYCYARLSTLKVQDADNHETNYSEYTQPTPQDTDGNSPIGIQKLTITKIEYNPSGSDKNNEKIYFAQNIKPFFSDKKLSDFSIDIYKNNSLYKTRKLSAKRLTQIDENSIQGDFTLPNTNDSQKDIIINIRYKTDIIARGEYNPYLEKNTFTVGKYRVTSVLDGDTFRIKYAGKTQSVRLLGIDAPESSIVRYGKAQCYGKEAKAYLKSLIDKKTVTLQPDSMTQERDKFGRWLAYVYLDDVLINKELLQQGYAQEYTYKNSSYQRQRSFQKRGNQAQKEKIGMWSDTCSTYNKETDKQQDATQNTQQANIVAENYDIQIVDISYNPPGSDYNNETISLLLQSKDAVVVDNDFRLVFHTHRKKLPPQQLEPGKIAIFTGNFQFPNSKATCVDLTYKDYIFDTYCYNPLQPEISSETNLSGEKLSTKESKAELIGNNSDLLSPHIEMKILAVLPNPQGKDAGNEQIKIILQGNIGNTFNRLSPYIQTESGKKTSFTLQDHEGEYIVQGNFGLKNSASCIKLYSDANNPVLMDIFCYTQVQENQRITSNNDQLSLLSTQDFILLTHAKLKRFGHETCLLYQDKKIRCISTPKIKYKTVKPEQLKQAEQKIQLYKNFTYSLKEHLQNNRYPLYTAQIAPYFSTLYEIEKNPKTERYTKYDHAKISGSDFQTIYNQKQQHDIDSYIEKYLSKKIPQSVREKYNELFALYMEQLNTNDIF